MTKKTDPLRASRLQRLIARVRRLPIIYQNLGFWRGLRYVTKRLFTRFYQQTITNGKIDIFSFYEFVREPEQQTSLKPINFAAKTINWVIPGFEIGSGGHLNIFRMIWHLEQLGYENRIVIVAEMLGTRFQDGATARKVIREHFFPLKAEVSLGEQSLRAAEFTVATSWHTAYSVRRFMATQHKVYFIQDMEAYFFAHSSDYMLAEATYDFGFTAITAGAWLAQSAEQYGMQAYPFEFSYDKGRYRVKPRRSGPRRVFFYARFVTPRRGFELGLLALKRVFEAMPEMQFVLAGWDTSGYAIPFPYLNAGVVALDELADLYSQCDVALVISLTNISLLPLELMACGCPVVSNRGPNVEWLLQDNETAVLCDATPKALANGVLRVLEDRALRERLAKNGLAFAETTDWAFEAQRVHGYFERIRGDGIYNREGVYEATAAAQ